MDITSDNFLDGLAQLRKSLATASFIAIDTEFTSVSPFDPKLQCMLLDEDFSERFPKLARTCMDATLLQFGMSVFSEQDGWDVQSFNVWTFPRTVPEFELCDPAMFACQASSIEFLSEHGFDFNKCISRGIGFLRRNERKVIEELFERPHYIDPETEKLFANWDKKSDLLVPVPRNRSCSLFASKLAQTFGHNVVVSGGNEIKVSPAKIAEIPQPDFLSVAGLSAIVEEIAKANVPIVCHNGMLDLMLLVHHCIEPLLPTKSPNKFKTQCKQLFPRIFDTKHILNIVYAGQNKKLFPANQSTSLGPIFRTLCQENRTTIEGMTELKLTAKQSAAHKYSREFAANPKNMKGNAHDAGFDSFMCGCVLVQLRKACEAFKVEVDELVNKINLIKAKCPFVDLDAKQDVEHSVEIQRFLIPNIFSRSKLSHIVTPYEFDAIVPNPLADRIELLVRCSNEGRDRLMKKHGKDVVKGAGLEILNGDRFGTRLVPSKRVFGTISASLAIALAVISASYFVLALK